MSGLLSSNTLIKQVEQQIEKNLKPDVKKNYFRIVNAGMKLAMNKGGAGLMANLKNSKDPLSDCVNGAIGIVGVLRKESKGTMPVDAMIPAAMTLVLHGLDIAERLGLMKVGKAELDQATNMFVETLLPKLGLTQQKIQGLSQQVHGIMSDPAKMAKIKATAPAQPAGA